MGVTIRGLVRTIIAGLASRPVSTSDVERIANETVGDSFVTLAVLPELPADYLVWLGLVDAGLVPGATLVDPKFDEWLYALGRRKNSQDTLASRKRVLHLLKSRVE